MIKKVKNVNEGKRSNKRFNVVTLLEILFYPLLLSHFNVEEDPIKEDAAKRF